MKLSKRHIQELVRKVVKSYMLEAEKEEKDPFATDDAEGGAEGGADAEGEKADDKEAKPAAPAAPAEPTGVPISFNISAVKRYNKANFVSDKGTVKSINKDGVIVTTQPDGVDILVNFDDISENVSKFFKTRK
jgi:hypothetical protein